MQPLEILPVEEMPQVPLEEPQPDVLLLPCYNVVVLFSFWFFVVFFIGGGGREDKTGMQAGHIQRGCKVTVTPPFWILT